MKSANVVCPVCGMRWTIETRYSWWLSYNRCYGCMGCRTTAATAAWATPPQSTERVMTDAECEPFRIGQLSLLEA